MFFCVIIYNMHFTFMQIFETLLRDVTQLKQDVRKFTFIMRVISLYRNRSKGSAITQNMKNMIQFFVVSTISSTICIYDAKADSAKTA